jgi:hypothetical protein
MSEDWWNVSPASSDAVRRHRLRNVTTEPATTAAGEDGRSIVEGGAFDSVWTGAFEQPGPWHADFAGNSELLEWPSMET